MSKVSEKVTPTSENTQTTCENVTTPSSLDVKSNNNNITSQGLSNIESAQDNTEGCPSTNSAETPGSETGPSGRTDIASQETSSGSHTGASQPVIGGITDSAGTESANESTECQDISSRSERNESNNSGAIDGLEESQSSVPLSDKDGMSTAENSKEKPTVSSQLLDTADEDSFQEKLRKSNI